MGERGPAPQPTALKLLRGNPGKRKLNEDEPKPEEVKVDSAAARCPKHLTGLARELWKKLAPAAMRSGLISVVDLPQFEAYCISYARWREFERLTGRNMDLAIAKGYRNGATRERELMLAFAKRFGFDPSSRSSVKAVGSLVGKAGGGPTESKADQFRRQKSGAAS